MYRSIVAMALIAMIASCFRIQAASVACEAGELSTCVEDLDITELSVSGTIDVRDFKFINEGLHNLVSINLGNAFVAGYECSDDECYFGKSGEFPAGELPGMCFFGKRYSSVVLPEGLKSIGEYSMAGCDKLHSIIIPSTVTEINEHAFNGSGIEELHLSGNLEMIGKGAFAGCRSLQVVDIGETTDCVIEDDAFARCVALEQVTMGGNVVSIGNGAFKGCNSLKTLKVEDGSGLAMIGDEAFMDTQLTETPFAGCSQLLRVGSWAFANASLNELSLPSYMSNVPEGVFFGNNESSTMIIPDNATNIDKFAFYGCSAINSFSIPNGMACIGDNAFESMSGLDKIVSYAKTVPELGSDVFYGINQPAVRLYVNDGLVNDYNLTEQWNLFEIMGLSNVSMTSADVAACDVRAYFDGDMLEITADTEMIRVTVVDISGIVVADIHLFDCQANVVVPNRNPSIFAARIELSNGVSHTMKLIKR